MPHGKGTRVQSPCMSIPSLIGGNSAARGGRASPERAMFTPAARTHAAVDPPSDFGRLRPTG